MKIKLIIIFICLVISVSGQNAQRKEINIPNVPGYMILKGDFHMHTYYSDGEVIPEVRVREAWEEGLDVIAITDHIEWWHFEEGEYASRNKPFDVAFKEAKKRDIILVRGIELTKSMPPGHMNLLFLEDVNKIDREDYRLALKEAKKQKAFIFWNHPGWEAQAPEGAKWYNEHTEMLKNGWMDGIEVVNWNEWYPIVLDWAIEKNLTLLGNSDLHMPVKDYLNQTGFEHRPMNLIFAKDKTQESIKEALIDGKTVLWFKDLIIGREKYAKMLIKESIKVKSINHLSENRYYIQIQNVSDLSFQISEINRNPKNINLAGASTIGFNLDSENSITELIIKLENVKISSNEVLEIHLTW